MNTWQQQGKPDEWVYGEVVRGVVRKPLAEVYFDADWGWVWSVNGTECRVMGCSFVWAIEQAEAALGLGATQSPPQDGGQAT